MMRVLWLVLFAVLGGYLALRGLFWCGVACQVVGLWGLMTARASVDLAEFRGRGGAGGAGMDDFLQCDEPAAVEGDWAVERIRSLLVMWAEAHDVLVHDGEACYEERVNVLAYLATSLGLQGSADFLLDLKARMEVHRQQAGREPA